MTVVADAIGVALDWAVASCRELGPAAMYPQPGKTSGRRPKEPLSELEELLRTQEGCEQLVALAVCTGCPIREQCLEDALERRDLEGVWGGKSSNQRRKILRKRNRGARSHFNFNRESAA